MHRSMVTVQKCTRLRKLRNYLAFENFQKPHWLIDNAIMIITFAQLYFSDKFDVEDSI
jgi:hypothetical protein